ncbi:ATP phosphoribosyltransferase regulatory subunit [Celeribacter indicus]|uniref:ATP phosphoribosyltransferase regulatory subunit n=1 Tax=Celeribacter indicus TaxID=1208324 RepID=A0A0B5E658_9RHOB|nr:ATP phosphoribosyltransferase regulatory subunit [Celeribacter indicus]AJE48516.1 ATP phosphoribosyltransferase regulatory subunit [Celeribacter indicus]SDX07562.1 ATP phosphoribosyltransferase regulatory subunit [Celeribacter indicus]
MPPFRPRSDVPKAEVRAEAARLRALFEERGALAVDPDILLPAEVLLDLYGEDIRARAYVTTDPERGEMMLRPDFTVPVVQSHMSNGAEPARYTYAGEVFRKQEDMPERANEYIQVGYEVFDGSDPAGADAEVFALFSGALAGHGLHAATGDIGILKAAVAGLRTTERRRAALLRHIWRPRRFRALMSRFSEAGKALREQNLARVRANLGEAEAPFIGLRTQTEIDARIRALEEDAAEPPISGAEIGLLDDILSLKETLPHVLSALRDIAVDLPAISEAVSRLDRRCQALSRRGVDVDHLDFEASYGRTSMEYYDGFVFGFYAEGRPDLPPVATGGRYDALTSVLGQGRSIPAVGGVIRPGLMLSLKGEA